MTWFDKQQPLWMPPKSVRSIIALAFTFSAIAAMFLLGAGVPEWFALLLGIIIRDYFASANVEQKDANEAQRAVNDKAA